VLNLYYSSNMELNSLALQSDGSPCETTFLHMTVCAAVSVQQWLKFQTNFFPSIQQVTLQGLGMVPRKFFEIWYKILSVQKIVVPLNFSSKSIYCCKFQRILLGPYLNLWELLTECLERNWFGTEVTAAYWLQCKLSYKTK
jgi:hypothetical protein